MKKPNLYAQIIESIFFAHHKRSVWEFDFGREEFQAAAKKLKIQVPKNLGDIVYSFRYRAALPKSVQAKAPSGKYWIIRPAGRGRYRFVAVDEWKIAPTPGLSETKVPDATPGIVTKYSFDDEQALLAKLRFEFEEGENGVTRAMEKHYRLVPPEQITPDDLKLYQERLPKR